MSVRETILNNFATALAGISIAGGYASDVEVSAGATAVERNVMHPEDVATGRDKVRVVLEDPAESENVIAFLGVKRMKSMTANVKCYVSGPRESGPQTPAGKIIADVCKLVDSPVSLGANANYAEVKSEEVKLTGDKSAVVNIPVEIVYWYSVSAP